MFLSLASERLTKRQLTKIPQAYTFRVCPVLAYVYLFLIINIYYYYYYYYDDYYYYLIDWRSQKSLLMTNLKTGSGYALQAGL
jgi:hypothetical protein